jgi:hypothetical protein
MTTKAKPPAEIKAAPLPKRGRGRPPRLDKRQAFLDAFARTGLITRAARAARIDRQQHYKWLAKYSEYRADFQQVKEIVVDEIEDEVRERAMRGVFVPNVFQGRFVYPQEKVEIEPAVLDRKGRVIKPARTELRDIPGAKPLGIYRPSDKLLIFLLRALKPETYRQSAAIELSGSDRGSIEIVERLNAARARMRRLAAENTPPIALRDA